MKYNSYPLKFAHLITTVGADMVDIFHSFNAKRYKTTAPIIIVRKSTYNDIIDVLLSTTCSLDDSFQFVSLLWINYHNYVGVYLQPDTGKCKAHEKQC